MLQKKYILLPPQFVGKLIEMLDTLMTNRIKSLEKL